MISLTSYTFLPGIALNGILSEQVHKAAYQNHTCYTLTLAINKKTPVRFYRNKNLTIEEKHRKEAMAMMLKALDNALRRRIPLFCDNPQWAEKFILHTFGAEGRTRFIIKPTSGIQHAYQHGILLVRSFTADIKTKFKQSAYPNLAIFSGQKTFTLKKVGFVCKLPQRWWNSPFNGVRISSTFFGKLKYTLSAIATTTQPTCYKRC